MPQYAYKCENGHKVTKIRKSHVARNRRFRCKECGLYMRRDYQSERFIPENKVHHLDRNSEPIHHLLNKDGTKGHWVNNLTPEPVYVRSKEQYDKLLRDTHSIEKQTGYGGKR